MDYLDKIFYGLVKQIKVKSNLMNILNWIIQKILKTGKSVVFVGI